MPYSRQLYIVDIHQQSINGRITQRIVDDVQLQKTQIQISDWYALSCHERWVVY
jgi:hypothetical protein